MVDKYMVFFITLFRTRNTLKTFSFGETIYDFPIYLLTKKTLKGNRGFMVHTYSVWLTMNTGTLFLASHCVPHTAGQAEGTWC